MRLLLRLLVHAFPPAFREEFGPELHEQIRVDHGRARERGAWALLVFGLGTAADLLASAIAERWSPSWARTDGGRFDTESGVVRIMGGWGRDLTVAARSLRRAPGFAAVVIVTLGLAVGANTGIFAIVSNVLMAPLPFENPDRLIRITSSAPGSDLPDEFGISPEFYLLFRDEATLLDGVAISNSFTATLRVEGRVERVPMSVPTPGVFPMLGTNPVLGRLPTPEDEDRVAVISHGLWSTWFGSDPTVIGRSYEIMDQLRTIIGVMPPEFAFPEEAVLLWVPDEVAADEVTPGRFGPALVARMAEGATIPDVERQLEALAARLPEMWGTSAAYARFIEQYRPVVRPARDGLVGAAATPLKILMSAVAIVLLIACANVANLFTVRAESRQRDLAVRRAMGAGRAQLIRVQMAEAVLLAAGGGLVGVLLARTGLPLFLQVAPPLPRSSTVSLDPGTLVFAFLICVIAAVACGAWPAFAASDPDLRRLRDSGRGSTRRRPWARNALVAGQTALALVLLVGSGLLLRSFLELGRVDPGYRTDDIFTFQIAPTGPDLNDGPSFAGFHLGFMERIEALPGVEMVGVVGELPLDEGVRSARFITEDREGEDEQGYLVRYTWTGGDYFRAMDIAVIRGRALVRADHETDLGNAVVSESAATLMWPGEEALGKRFRNRTAEGEWQTVVGVVEDIKQDDLRETPEPLIYQALVGHEPDSWLVASPGYVVRTSQAAQMTPQIRALVDEVAPRAPMYAVHTMESLRADSLSRLSFTMITLATASGLALLMGSIGLYGVLAYVVALRTKEIGVRMALGARAEQVRRMVVTQGARVVALGIGVGLVLAAATTRALSALLFGTGPLDLATFAATAVVMVGVGALASYLPARRASNLDPVESLRAE